jgi:hypothetical protein
MTGVSKGIPSQMTPPAPQTLMNFEQSYLARRQGGSAKECAV